MCGLHGLGELEQDRFDGAYLTKSFGRITDYNLMVAKGNQGFLDVIMPEAESSEPAREVYPDYELYTCAFYCRSGFAAITCKRRHPYAFAGRADGD